MRTDLFGKLDGHAVEAVTLSNAGIEARLITYGARLTELWVPDAGGRTADIVLGYDDLESYASSGTYFGATCGQYANRIAGGRCHLNGEAVQLDQNEGPNHLHGGSDGFDRKIWRIAALDDNSVTFSATTEDREMGYPGRSNLSTRYRLTHDGALEIEMRADTDRTTLINMVHHSYFNLASEGAVLDHALRIASQFYTPVTPALLATGEIRDVRGTPFDFRTAKRIGADIAALCPAPEGGGYDHNWCLEGVSGDLRPCAMLRDPVSGRTLQLFTTEPGVQVYTGGFLNDTMMGKRGKQLCRFAGVALETQKFPGSPGFAHFPDCTLHPGESYCHKMVYRFGTSASG